MAIPLKSDDSGWPQYLTDNDGERYVLLRDGNPATDDNPTGESVLYGLLRPDGFIDREHQWIPVLGATLEDMRLTGGSWSSSKQLELYRQTPLTMPDEPVVWPDEGELGRV